jgi:hypothetical protein
MGGQMLSEHMKAVGPTQAGKAAKKAFGEDGALTLFMKEVGLEDGLNAIAAAFPSVNIEVSFAEGD